MEKVIIGIKDDIVFIQDLTFEQISDIVYLRKPSESYKIEINSIKLEDNYYIKLENDTIIKLLEFNQLEQVPKFVNRLFCFIDDKNNLYIPLGVDAQILGNLEIVNNNIFVRKKMLLDDFKFFRQEILSKSIPLSTTIDDNGKIFLKSFFMFNDKAHFNNFHFGFIDSVVLATENDVDEDDYLDAVTVGDVIIEKLYENPIEIKIIAHINDGNIYAVGDINNIVMFNNKNISNNVRKD